MMRKYIIAKSWKLKQKRLMFKMAYNWNIDGIIQPNLGKLQHKMVLDAHNSQTNQGKLEFQYISLH
jgi:hypothetical protein